MEHPVITNEQAKIIGHEIGKAIWEGFNSWLYGSAVPHEVISDFTKSLATSIGKILKKPTRRRRRYRRNLSTIGSAP